LGVGGFRLPKEKKVKACSKCGRFRPLDDFHRNRAAPDGKRAECKDCACERARTYGAANYVPRVPVGLIKATCAHCGDAFEYERTVGPLRKYCSDQHRYEAGELQKQARAPEHVRRCRCGSTNVHPIGKPVCAECKKDPRDRSKDEWKRKLRLYNITQADWDAMVERQGNRCAIAACRTDTPGGRGESWAIDHDHRCCPRKGSCGECVRGLLCNNCNMAMGSAGDDPARLRALADYIEAARQPPLFAVA
jgi:hypothetical protein